MLRFAVNHLAGFLPTRLLEPLLIAAAPARIVNVASAGQMPIDFDDVMLGVTATALHPATYMPTKLVIAAAAAPVSSSRA
ncbi:MAG: hypothetical protein QOD81_2355 [Solirubrobacteraceae bacterium]|nr:hypothetical protein [Solirubrobacteraceae bacterium]